MDFVSWLVGEMDKREWSQADLARKGNLTAAQISRVIARQQSPGQKFCEGIAKAFNLPVEQVFRNADLLSDKAENDALDDEALFLMRQMKSREKKRLVVKLIRTLSEEDGGVSSRHITE